MYIKIGTTTEAMALSLAMYATLCTSPGNITLYYCSWAVHPSRDEAWILVPNSLPDSVNNLIPGGSLTATYSDLQTSGFFPINTNL